MLSIGKEIETSIVGCWDMSTISQCIQFVVYNVEERSSKPKLYIYTLDE